MGEYKRLISYIYSYEKGVKGKNAGFAKIESRNGVCRISLSVRFAEELLNETEDNMMEVYFFSRNQSGIKKYYLEQMRIVKGSSVIKINKNLELFGGEIEGLSGIFICSPAFFKNKNSFNLIYASEWDDIPIEVEDFRKEEPLGDSNLKSGNIENILHNQNSELHVAYIGEEEYEKVADTSVSQMVRESAGILPVEMAETESENMKEPQTAAGILPEPQAKELSESRFKEISSEKPESVADIAVNETEITDNAENIRTQGDRQESAGCCDTAAHRSERMEKENETNGMEINEEKNFFQILSGCYPKVRLNEIDGECIKITPHDISYLPKKYWQLCNNSFMLHGFYNYRYLILCEKIMNGTKRYLIGVPGLYHQREQTMARMFGFTEFEGNKRNGTMNFGYWCMYL
ncbi:MAG: hypothetical protein HFI34_09160 [Lachnospiraceae bacterium]|nr:hypothetical protein [Lachnospiraceae bacterium]